MIRLVGLDLDGTLLSSDKSLSGGNEEALRRASEAGAYIVPVTGRPLSGLPSVVERLPYVRYVITSNGAVVYDLNEGRAIRERLMSREKALEVLDIADLPGTIFEYFTDGYGYHDDDGWAYLTNRFGTRPLMSYIRKSRRRVDDLKSGILSSPGGIENISTMSLTGEEQSLIYERLGRVEGIRRIVPCGTDLEITSSEADKGSALLALAAYLGIERAQVLAMGDGDNDRSMMEAAGLAVAVANADDRIMQAADHVAASNDEDGVAEAIRRFVLEEI